MDDLRLVKLSDIDQSLWIEYWKGLADSGAAPKAYQRILKEDWNEKLEQLKKEETGTEPYGLKCIQYVLMDTDKILGNGSIFLNPEVVPAEQAPNHIGGGISPLYRNKGYGTYMVHLFIKKLDELCYNEIIICCDDTNIPSSRMIEKNSGVLKEKFYSKRPIPGYEEEKLYRRYIVNVKESIKKYEQELQQHKTNHY